MSKGSFPVRTILVLVCILTSPNLFGQTYTRVLNDFTDSISGIDQTAWSYPLDFVSMASNGYGHWAVTSDGKWFLMSNDLQRGYGGGDHESEPKGPVQGGEFLGDTAWDGGWKVATNLRGSVRFVAPSSGHASFLVYGFDDEHIRSGADTPDINLKFTGIPKGYKARVPVKRAPRLFSPVLTTGTSIVEGDLEISWEDWFDIACDGTYLYIVWEEYVSTTSPPEIWVTVTDLLTNTVQTGFPLRITTDPTPPNINTALFGQRPTIACDVRNNSNP
jgi:hypothetical protein